MSTTVCPTLIIGSEPYHDIVEVLTDAYMHVVRTSAPERFLELVRECRFGVLFAPTRGREPAALLSQVVAKISDAHFVLIESAHIAPPPVGSHVESRRITALITSADPTLVRRAVRRAWFEAQAERIGGVMRQALLPASLSCAVSTILRERVTLRNPEPGEVNLCTSLAALAEQCGVSTDALRRARKGVDLDLRAMMREWRVALALREYFVEDDLPPLAVWAVIGRRCGYEGESGIRGLIARVLGVGLDALTFDHLSGVLARLHSRVSGAVSSDPARREPRSVRFCDVYCESAAFRACRLVGRW